MDDKLFDGITQRFAKSPTRRTVVGSGLKAAAAAALTAVGATNLGIGQADARRRRRRCHSVGRRQVCNSNAQCCPGTTRQVCGFNGCRFDNLSVCCSPTGGSCLIDCDCCGQSLCIGGTCI